ncbi:hypothetical protein AKO1_007954 [Acrasis kona]|uniref:Translation initiation factor eIF2B subunit delta n=1 Tax=Acrasis kona TaxID=1008807 RepID=A0AAW2YP01_9EUKA
MTKEERKALYSKQVDNKKTSGNTPHVPSTGQQPRKQSIKSDQAPTPSVAQTKNQEAKQQPSKHQDGKQQQPKLQNQKQLGQKNKVEPTESTKQNRLFSHLDKYVHPDNRINTAINDPKLHPIIVQLGLQYATGAIRGGNARTLALLIALKQVTSDYVQLDTEIMNRDFGNKIVPMIDYLKQFRPLSVGMGNALRHIKQKIFKLNPDLSANENKNKLVEDIDIFIKERITVAAEQIVNNGVARITNGDVIMTYARSEVIEKILTRAHCDGGKRFRVIIVDSRPKNEGRELLNRLLIAGVDCTYVYINAVSHVMKEVTKVMIGANSMLSNGSVYSRIGTAPVCMMANSYNVPVLVCCETYKFSEGTQLDSITRNELGDPHEMCTIERNHMKPVLMGHESNPNIHVLNLTYDVTDMQFVDMVITEVGSIPPTSVAVIVREYRQK